MPRIRSRTIQTKNIIDKIFFFFFNSIKMSVFTYTLYLLRENKIHSNFIS